MEFPSFSEEQLANVCVRFMIPTMARRIRAHTTVMALGKFTGTKEAIINAGLLYELTYNPKLGIVKNIVSKSSYKPNYAELAPYSRLATKLKNVV